MSFKVSTREAFGNFQDMTFTWSYVFLTAIENIGDRLPLPSSFNDFEGFGFVGTGVGSGGFSVSETDFFTAPRAFLVPLPGSIALVALGFLLLGWRRLAKGQSHQRIERSLGQRA